MERKSFSEAVRIVLDTLKTGEPYSISRLSREAGLNRRTVEKALEILEETQKYFLEKKLDITKLGQARLVQLSERAGLLNLPEDLQRLIIRTAYYPTPSREEEILVHLYREKAFSPESAIALSKSTLIQKLLKQGQLLEASSGNMRAQYLSDEGKIVAEGALKLYPELKTYNKTPKV
jgi:predicted transcriptional regulator